MGLGLFLRTSVLGQREAPTPSGDALLERIVDLGDAYSRRDPDCLGVWYQGEAGDGRASVLLFPIEEPLELWLAEDRLWCSAKTSTAGPGYHAHVVEFLDLVAEDLGVAWEDEIADDSLGDETGYFRARDFPALQLEMTRFLRGIAEMLLSDRFDADEPVLIGFSTDYPQPQSIAFALSSLGEWPRSFFAAVLRAEDQPALALAGSFFPWWEQHVTPRNLHGFGLALAWVALRWTGGHALHDEHEWRLSHSVLTAFRRGAPGADLPPAPALELKQLERVMNEQDGPIAPSPEGVGFRRRPMRHTLAGNWSIVVPGYYAMEHEDDGRISFFFPGRTVWVSSLSFVGPGARDLERVLELGGLEDAEAMTLELPHLRGRMRLGHNEQEQCRVLDAHVAIENGLCIVSIYYEDEADEAWARDVARSVRCPARSPEETEPVN